MPKFTDEELQRALVEYTAILKKEPRNDRILHQRANTLHLLQRYPEAVEAWTLLLDILPNHAHTLRNRAFTYFQMQDFELAEKDFNASLELKPNDPKTLYSLGVLLRTTHRYEAACQVLTDALIVKPDAPDSLYTRGLVYADLRQPQRACQDFNRAVDLYKDPENIVTVNRARMKLYDQLGCGNTLSYILGFLPPYPLQAVLQHFLENITAGPLFHLIFQCLPPSVELLDLRYNRLGDAHAKILLQHIQSNPAFPLRLQLDGVFSDTIKETLENAAKSRRNQMRRTLLMPFHARLGREADMRKMGELGRTAFKSNMRSIFEFAGIPIRKIVHFELPESTDPKPSDRKRRRVWKGD